MNEQINEYQRNDAEVIQSLMNPDEAKKNKESFDKDNAYKEGIKTITNIPEKWTTKEIPIKSKDGNSTEMHTFTNVDNSRKKEIIQAINELPDQNKLAF